MLPALLAIVYKVNAITLRLATQCYAVNSITNIGQTTCNCYNVPQP